MFGIDDAIGAGIGIVGNIMGGIAGKQAGQGDIQAGKSAITDAYNQLAQIGLPPDLSKKIIFQQFQQKGLLTPELEQHINQAPSQMANVQGSQPAQKAQMEALQLLQQRGQTGLTPEDRSALNQIRQQAATDVEAKRQQVLQNFAARGQGGSGAELIAALQGSQSGANAESQAGDRLAAMVSQNALQAIGQAGTLGGQIEQQRFGEGAEKAKAQDIINQFNTANQVGQQARNVGAQNTAQQYNLQTGQQLQNLNTTQTNQELLRENEAKRQNYLDTLTRANTINQAAQGYGGAMSGYGKAASESAAAPWQAIGAAGAKLGGAGAFNSMFGGSPQGRTTNNVYQAANGTIDPNQAGAGLMYDGGKVSHYNEGGDAEPSLSDKISDYFSTKPVQEQHIDTDKANAFSESLKASLGHAEGGHIMPPHLAGLQKIFPNTPPQVLQDIHMKANPHMYEQGGPVDPMNHQRRLPVTDYRGGGHVNGPEIVSGDSPKNDVMPAMLSGGEYVVKKTVAKSPFGKKLIKLLEAHSDVMKHAPTEEK